MQADEAAIRAVLERQAADWNRGDLRAFATGYKKSPDTLYIGRSVRRGYDQMLAGYLRAYDTPEKRGVLSFRELEVHPLDARFATVVGKCHLQKATAAGGASDCIFSLVWEKTAGGWKIILDHSSPLDPAHPTAASAAPPSR